MPRTRRATAPPGGAGQPGAAWAAWLAFGERPEGIDPPSAGEWPAILAFATRERLAALAWRRSARFIRSSAPPECSARWRGVAAGCDAEGRRAVEALHDLVAALDADGIESVALKGPALGERLYGDAFVRPLNDLDVYVPADARARAAGALAAAGWRLDEPAAPLEESFRKEFGGRLVFVEVHSSLTDDALTWHLRLPAPESVPLRVGGGERTVRAHGGDLLPAYLAAHLAKHTLPPLLWLVDFATLWRSLDGEARARARAAARAHRVGRYLEWAVRRAALLERVVAGDVSALEALGYRERDRREVHRLARVAALADTPLDAARVVGGWAFPPAMRGNPRAMAALMAERVRKPWGSTLTPRTAPPDLAAAGGRALRLGRESLVELARAAKDASGTIWVRIHGTSMLPAIPREAMVRLSPLPDRPLRAGDVVLFERETGGPVLHRIVAAGEGEIRTHGDNCHDPDPPTPLDRVLMIADLVSAGGETRPIGPAPRRVIRGLVRRLRHFGT